MRYSILYIHIAQPSQLILYTLINTIPRVSTLYPGMEQILERTGNKATVASVLLLTDGQADQSRDTIIAKMKGLTVSTVV